MQGDLKNMEYTRARLTKKERFKMWTRRNAFYLVIAGLMAVILVAIAIVASLTKPNNGDLELEVNTPKIEWGMPVEKQNIEVIKPYSATQLQENTAFQRWEIHKAIDIKLTETDKVVSILKGVVVSVTKGMVDGHVVIIEHEGGMRSIYGSLSDDIKVKTGDAVEKGAHIGYGGTSSSKEADMGVHLHFAIEKDGNAVDPNGYIKFS